MSENAKNEGWLCARNPVVFHYNGLGDRLIALPTVRALCSLFDGNLKLVCGVDDPSLYYSDLQFKLACEVHFTGHSDGWTFDARQTASAIGECDLFISLNTWDSPSSRELLRLLNPLASIGFCGEVVRRIPLAPLTHMSDVMFEVAKALKADLRMKPFSRPVHLPREHMLRARSFRERLQGSFKIMTIHTETLPAKTLGPEKLSSVLNRFLDEHPLYAGVLLGKQDRGAEEFVPGVVHIPLPLATCYALVGQSDLFLGVDSCFLHAADLFRVPSVGLFGRTDPRVFGFRFAPHQHVWSGSRMDDIDEMEVYRALARMARLAARRGGPT